MKTRTRRLLTLAALLAMAAIFLLTLTRPPHPPAQAAPPGPSLAPPTPATPPTSLHSPAAPPPGSAPAAPPTGADAPPAPPGGPPLEDPAATGPRYYAALPAPGPRRAAEADAALQTVAFAVHAYLAALGQVPVGSNPEITRALLGENSRNAHYLRADLPLNAQGELVDRWGTPYFFHQISRTHIDLYSAGPDRTMWTGDDELAR